MITLRLGPVELHLDLDEFRQLPRPFARYEAGIGGEQPWLALGVENPSNGMMFVDLNIDMPRRTEVRNAG